MNIKKILGITELDENTSDNLDMLLSERVTEIHRTMKKTEDKRDEEWEKLENQMRALFNDPELYDDFMLQLTDYQAQKEDDFYLHGLKDGIKIMKIIMQM